MVADTANVKKQFKERISERLIALGHIPRVIRLAWESYPVGSIAIPIATLVAGSLPAGYLFCIKKVIDGVTVWVRGDAATGRQTVVLFLALAFVTRLVEQGINALLQFFNWRLQQLIRWRVQEKIAQRANTLDQSFFDTPAFYDKLERARSEAFRTQAVITAITRGGREVITVCTYVSMLALLAWWIIPCLLIITIPGWLLRFKYGWLRWRISFIRIPEERLMYYYFQLMTSKEAAKELRLFGLADHLAKLWRNAFRGFMKQDMQIAAQANGADFVASAFRTATLVGLYAYVIYRTVTDARVTIGDLFLYTQAMERTLESMGYVFDSISELYENTLFVSNLFEYLKQEPQITPPEKPALVPSPIRHGIRFEGVSFRYPGCPENVLHDVSFEIGVGEKIALVGENGAGKTTLVKLLSRLYDPQEGRITVDGIDLRQIDPKEWFRQFGIIFQDFVKYWVTARENVGFGQLEYVNDLPRIRAAGDKSGATDCIERLDKSWDTVLGRFFTEGHELSVGEWQKVALARAFLREAQVLVLDEPTASLDAKQEYEIFKRFNELTQGKTTILVSHRFSTVRMADRIFVIERGRLIESGSHDELVSLGGIYADLFDRQASAYR